MNKRSMLLASLMISTCAVTAFAADNLAAMRKTRAQVMQELALAIKSGELIEPFTNKAFKDLYPSKYPMSDSDAEKMANEMMKNTGMMKK